MVIPLSLNLSLRWYCVVMISRLQKTMREHGEELEIQSLRVNLHMLRILNHVMY